MTIRKNNPSLLRRILLVMVFSIAVTAVGSFVFTNIAARSAFGQYVTRSASMRRQNLALALQEYYSTTGGWAGVETILRVLTDEGSSRGHGAMAGHGANAMRQPELQRITLLDIKGRVVADSGGEQPGTKVAYHDWETTALVSDSKVVGLLLLGMPADREAVARLYTDFVRSTTVGTLYSVGGAAVLAFLLSYFITQKTTRPIRGLTDAVSRVAGGDLGVRVEAEGDDESARLAGAFNVMLDRLQALESQRKDLISDVAHELRTPLAVLKSNLEAAKDGIIPYTPRLADTLTSEVDRLSRLVADLHVLALKDSGRLELMRETLNAKAVLDYVRDAFGALAAAKAVKLESSGSDKLCVWADRTRLIQVLSNLVDNAIRHTPADGTVGLFVKQEGKKTIFEVADTGQGLSEKSRAHVFDRFYRVDSSRARKTGGAGLGLSIASEIVNAHHGEISVKSVLGKGTTFGVSLDSSQPGAADNR